MSQLSESCPTLLRWRLREATRPQHDAVERCLSIHEQTTSTGDYCRLLQNMWGFYSPLENALLRLNWRGSDIVIDDRCKSGWLKSDLMDLGHELQHIDKLPQCSAIPIIDSVPRGLGALYVVEGATLGGQVIVRQLAPELGIGPAFAGRFFSSYGAAVSRMWLSYLTALQKVGCDRDGNAAVECAAIETFSALQTWLENADGMRHRHCAEVRAE